MTKTRMILTGALFALAVFALVLSPYAALAEKKPMAKAKGFITAVGTDTVTIHDTASDADVIVNVVESTKIHKNNVEGAAIEDLAVGDKATAKYNTETMDAKRIQAKSPKAKVSGEITAIGADSVTIQPATGDPVTVLVGEDTKITLNDEPATLGDLAIGDQAKAKYDPTTMIAKFIHASNEPDDDEE